MANGSITNIKLTVELQLWYIYSAVNVDAIILEKRKINSGNKFTNILSP